MAPAAEDALTDDATTQDVATQDAATEDPATKDVETPDTKQGLPSTFSVVAQVVAQAGPRALCELASMAPELVNTIYIGRHGNKDQLAAVGLANMMQNVFGLSIGIGLCGALDVLASQAHGSGELKLACTYSQRGRLVLSLQLVWMWPVLSCCDKWLTAAGQDPTVALYAAEYNSTTAPFLLIYFQNECLSRLLGAFLRPQYNCLISGISTLLHVAWVQLFLGHMGLGNRGLGLANGVCWMTRFLLTLVTWWKLAPALGVKRSWVLGFQRDAMRGWGGFLKLGLPALVQTASEWWFWEICAFVVGYLGNTALAAHVATIQFVVLPLMLPLGIGAGVGMLAGNAIGAGSAGLAHRFAWVTVKLSLAVWTVVALLIGLFLDFIASALTRDAEVQGLAKILISIYALQGFADSSQSCMSKILRGLGEVRIPSITYMVTYYVIALPLAIFLAFPMGLGVKGVWLAVGVSSTLLALIFSHVLRKMDYQALVKEARQRIDGDECSLQG